ncbi:MAG TPA: hypothetical protein VIP46_11190 [Pyrinomonadaceae bacterium]
MIRPRFPRPLAARLLVVLALVTCALASAGCSRLVKSKVAVPQLLSPLQDADTARLIEEANRAAQVRSLRGKVDLKFLDNSFAQCGIAEEYTAADADITTQRPGQIYLTIQDPFIGSKIAEMSSNGEKFWVAVLKGDADIRRFVTGTNAAQYERLGGGGEVQCGKNTDKTAMRKRAVSAFSGLRPQHFTDALLPRPAGEAGLVYARNEAFAEEPDTRRGAKNNARVVRGYYQLEELRPEAEGRAQLLRRFWFDRFGGLRLARVQTFDERGTLTTDVVYRDPRPFGEGRQHSLPAEIEITRPQDRYSIRINYQTPEAVRLDQQFPSEVFVLPNKDNLPVFDLDTRKP